MRAIKDIRLKHYDYQQDGYYFVTITTDYNRPYLVGKTRDVVAQFIGQVSQRINGAAVDYHEIMPTHVHMILVLDNCKFELGEVVRRFKAVCSKEAGIKLWQPNYYEHVIRNDRALDKIREYIRNNPQAARIDCERFYDKRTNVVAQFIGLRQPNPDKSGQPKPDKSGNYNVEKTAQSMWNSALVPRTIPRGLSDYGESVMRKFLLTLVFSVVFIGTASAATITKTICSSGCDYTSLDACLDANAQDLTDVGGDIFEAQITGAFEDTTAVTMGNVWTTSPTCYVRIYTTAAVRHQGVWDEAKYHISVGNATAVTISENYVRVEGLQVVHTPSSGSKSGISVSGSSGTAEVRVYKNIVKAVPATGADSDYGIVVSDTGLDMTAYIYNNIIYDYKLAGAYNLKGIYPVYHGATYIYNNTVFNCKEGYQQFTSASSGAVVAVNNIANDCTDGFAGTFTSSDYNASDIASDAPGANSRNGTDGNVTFNNEAGDDFRLAASDNNARNRGTTNPGSGLYSDDIEGNARVVPWDIGADEVADTGNAIFFGTNF